MLLAGATSQAFMRGSGLRCQKFMVKYVWFSYDVLLSVFTLS